MTPEETRTLLPLLLASPSYASYAFVLSHLATISVEEAQQQVEAAFSQGEKAWNAFIQLVRTVLRGLRLKLHGCGLDIVAVQHSGYLLRAWKKALKENGEPEQA